MLAKCTEVSGRVHITQVYEQSQKWGGTHCAVVDVGAANIHSGCQVLPMSWNGVSAPAGQALQPKPAVMLDVTPLDMQDPCHKQQHSAVDNQTNQPQEQVPVCWGHAPLCTTTGCTEVLRYQIRPYANHTHMHNRTLAQLTPPPPPLPSDPPTQNPPLGVKLNASTITTP